MDKNSVQPVQGPDCMTCWRKNICPQAEEGKICGQWQSKEPAPKGKDPNEAWNRGEDVYL